MSSHYNPNQRRVPAGHSDAGQWTGDGSPEQTILNSPLLDRRRLINAALGIRDDDAREEKGAFAGAQERSAPGPQASSNMAQSSLLTPDFLAALARSPYLDRQAAMRLAGGIPAGGGPSSEPLDAPITSFQAEDGRNVTVTFQGKTSDGKTGDQVVTGKLSSWLRFILSDSGVDSVNISATTNGHEKGDHVYGDAVDINRVNGARIADSAAAKAAAINIQWAAMISGGVRFVEGPLGNFARSTPIGSWVRVGPGDQSHVHISVFPVK